MTSSLEHWGQERFAVNGNSYVIASDSIVDIYIPVHATGTNYHSSEKVLFTLSNKPTHFNENFLYLQKKAV